jgi:cold shock CspA family protein
MQVKEPGIIKSYLPDRGFGFLRTAGGIADVFFHFRDCEIDQEDLRPGMGVVCRVVADLKQPGRWRAVDVALLDASGNER